MKRCPTCERRRERSATPTALVSGAPLVVAPAALALPAGLRDRVMQSVSSATTSGPPGADQAASGGSSRATQPLGSAMLTDWPGGWPPPLDEAPGRATGRIVTAAVAVTVIVVVALAVALRLSGGDEEIDVAERRVPPTSAPAAGPAADAAVGPGPAAPEPDASAPPPPAAPPQDPRPRPPTPSEPPPTPPPSASEPVDDPVASPPTTPPVVRTLTVHVVAGDRPSQITSSAGSPAPLTCDVGETCTFPVAEGTTVVVTGASFSEPCVEYGTCVVVMDVDRVLSVYGPPIL